jgi:cytochrome c
MNGFEFNKIAGALLGTAVAVFGLNSLTHAIYNSPAPEKPGFLIQVAEAQTSTDAAAPAAGDAAAPAASIGARLKAADATKGATAAKACGACHDFTKGGPNKVGPNLYDVVERPIASHEGFAYSDAMKARSAEKWTYENIDQFVTDPKAVVKGTKMSFAGLKKPEDRANLLAYLATLSDSPKPFPAP